MRVLGVIPARYASSRFPGKPLVDLKGKSMIRRVYEGASKSTLLSAVVVATDDERIVEEVESFGGKVVMTSISHRTGTDRCAEVAESFDCDVVVNIQGDEPLVNFKQIEGLCEAFQEDSVMIATLGISGVSGEELHDPNRIKIVVDKDENALYFSRSPIPNNRNSIDNDYPYLRHIGLYAYRKETLLELSKLRPTKLEEAESLEQLRWLFNGYAISVVTTDIETPNIDVPEDVENVLSFL
jgi:3-deoxy-manno-octulosonate cytidylyltransferase (CMP-KDO synthetase)